MIGIDLSVQRTLVTGANGGIGAGIARRLAEAGVEGAGVVAAVISEGRTNPTPR